MVNITPSAERLIGKMSNSLLANIQETIEFYPDIMWYFTEETGALLIKGELNLQEVERKASTPRQVISAIEAIAGNL